MKKITFSFLLTLASTFSFAQLGLPVGGGSSVTGAVCTEGQVYTWGLNRQGGVSGTLGVGTTAQNEPLPKQVIFPLGITIQQLGAGSGGFFMALDCNQNVWSWGGNDGGQLGVGDKVSRATPQKVLVQAGSPVDVAGFRDPVTGQLRRISKLFAGNSSSLAITDDGRLLSWGCNSGTSGSCDPPAPGILGNGNTNDALYPTFVIDGATGQPLENVIDMSIGDHLAMALVDVNQEGIGIGTVYTWGDGSTGTLGRNALGTGNTGAEATGSNVARPARLISPTGGPAGDGHLRNIQLIAAGDVAGYAVDVEGYVWAWGNGGYGGVTGQGTTATHSDPRRVLKGLVTGAGTDGTYLLAKSIAAGNAFAMAVTVDGRPVAWGNNACSGNAAGPAASPIFACGGNLGNNGVGATATTPVFIQNSTGGVHSDVAAVARGDFWGYYIREDNSVWTWGDNIVGQLGIGGYTTQNRAVVFNGIANCSRPDPAPDAKISPRDTAVCASKLSAASPIVLNAGFVLAAPLINLYEFTWYRVANPASAVAASDTTTGNIVRTGWGSTFSTYNATQQGRYWVRVKYKGTKVPCGGYPPAYDYMTITVFPATFTAPTNLTWCGDSATVRVTQIIPPANSKAVYSYYPTAASTTILGNSVGNGTKRINVSSIVANGAGDKIVFVEETGEASGVVAPLGAGLSYSTSNSNGENRDTKLVVYEDVTLDSLRFGYLINTNQAGAYNPSITISVFGEINSCGSAVSANRAGGPISTSPAFSPNISWPANTPVSVVPLTIPVNLKLKGSAGGTVYWIGFTNAATYTSTNQNSGPVQLTGTPNFSDNISGNVVKLTATDINDCAGTNAGVFHNFNIKKSQKYCDRLPIVLKQLCPCQQPASVTVTSTPAAVAAVGTTPKSVTVCVGTAVTLNGSYVKGINPLTGTMNYVWYKKGTTPGAYTAFTPATSLTAGSKSLTGVVADSGVWYLRVEDYNGTSSISSCYKMDSILVAVKRIPLAPAATAPADFCENSTAPVWTATASTGNSLLWYTTATLGTGTATAPVIANTPSGARDIWVSQRLTASPNCEGPRTALTLNVIAVPAAPSATAPADFCENSTVPVWTATSGSGNSLLWYTTATLGTGTPAAPAITNTPSGARNVWVSQRTTAAPNCESARTALTLNVLPAPAAPAATAPANFCENATSPVWTATAVTGNSLLWYTAASGGVATAAAPAIANSPAGVRNVWVSQRLTASPNCEGPRTPLTLTVTPATIITKQPKDTTLCEGSALNLVVSASGTGPFSYQWKQGTTNVGTDSRTYTKASSVLADAGSYTVTVTGGCEAPVSNAAVVTINSKPVITVQPVDASGCENSNSSLNVTATGTGPLTYQWKKVSGGNVGTNSNSLPFTPLKASDAGDYTVTVSNSCSTAGVVSTQVKVNITLTEKPGVILSIDSTALCSGNSIVLTASGTGGGAAPKYTFSDANGTVGTADQLSNKVTLPLTNAGPADKVETYTVKMFSNSGCLESGAVNPAESLAKTVTVYAKPAAAVAGSPEIICGSTYQLKGVAPAIGTGKWTASPASVSFDDATKADAIAGSLPAGSPGTPVAITFTWTVKNGTCPAVQSSVVITRSGDLTDPAPTVDKITVCEGGAVILGGATPSSANNETSKWSVNPTTGVSLTSTANTAAASATFTAAGPYVFTYEIDNPTCNPSGKTVTVNVIAPPVADITDPGSSQKLISKAGTSIAAVLPGTGYTGTWYTPLSPGQQGRIKLKTGSESDSLVDLFKTEEEGAGQGTTDLIWVVKDNSGICKNDTDKVVIIRRNLTPPNAGKDTVLCVANLPKVFKGNGTSSIPVIETYKWTELNVPAIATINGNDFTLPMATPPGTYKFEFSIQNSVSGSDLKDTVSITVHAETQVPVLQAAYTGTTAAAPYLLCSSSVNLPGVATTQSLGKNWWKSVPLNIPVTDSTATPAVTVPAGPGSATFYYRNGVCPEKTTDFFFEKVGDVTPAQVTINGGKPLNVGKQYVATKDSIHKLVNNTADTLCIGGDYTLTARALKTGETGTWSIAAAGTITLDPVNPVTSATQKLIVGGPGETQLKWSVKNTSPLLASCPANETTIKLVVHDIPTGGIIDGNAFVCEGTDTLYKVNPVATSTLTPITYTWDAGTPGASRTGSATGASTRYKFTSDAAGTITQGTIRVTAGNACGSAAPVSKVVTIRLAPRNFTAAPGNTDAKILGPKVFCATETLVGYKLDEIQQNVDGNGYRWYWDNKLITSRTDTAAIGIGQVTNWDPSLNSTHTIKVELTNHCSDTARIRAGIPVIFKDTIVKVIAPAPVTVTLSSDKMGNKFCVPDDQVIFTPTISTTLTGLVTDYTFKVDGIVQQGPGILSTYTVGRNFLKDGAKVTVELSPAASQCINYSPGGIPSNIVEMEGFQYPDSIITGADTICEQKSVVMLNVSRSATLKGSLNDNGGISWYKDGALMSPQPSGFSLSLTNPSETGRYTVKVTGSVCATHTSVSTDTARVKIFEQPRIIVLKNPYAVPYVEGVNAFTMPVYVPELARDTFTTKTYVPEIWLRDPKEPGTVLVPEREEKTQPYWLNLATGNPDANGVYGGCRAQEMIVIVYYLPVIIPNAFTPNGDGLNDTWVITGLGKYPNTKVKVYNRWGTAMYVDNDGYRAVWDGTHNGQPLPTGTYYYIVELKGSPDGTDENRTGHLTIIR